MVCSSSSNGRPEKLPAMIDHVELRSYLKSTGIRDLAILYKDWNFVLPEPDWITKDLSISIGAVLKSLGLKWTDTAFDCDKFSLLAKTIAVLSWAVHNKENRDVALAFGQVSYIKCDVAGNTIGAHSINVAIHRKQDGGLETRFYEPQPDIVGVCLREIKLIPDEFQSIYFVEF